VAPPLLLLLLLLMLPPSSPLLVTYCIQMRRLLDMQQDYDC